MSQIQSLKNQGLNHIIFKTDIESPHSNTSDLETVLNRLYHRENEIFKRIVIAIRINDDAQSTMLASELLRIRVLKRNICFALELLYNYNTRHSYLSI